MKPTIPEVIDRFRAYYDRVGWSWGSLHIVLSDGNIEDHFVKWCVTYAVDHGDVEGAELANVLLAMSRTQRLRLPALIEKIDGYPNRIGA